MGEDGSGLVPADEMGGPTRQVEHRHGSRRAGDPHRFGYGGRPAKRPRDRRECGHGSELPGADHAIRPQWWWPLVRVGLGVDEVHVDTSAVELGAELHVDLADPAHRLRHIAEHHDGAGGRPRLAWQGAHGAAAGIRVASASRAASRNAVPQRRSGSM